MSSCCFEATLLTFCPRSLLILHPITFHRIIHTKIGENCSHLDFKHIEWNILIMNYVVEYRETRSHWQRFSLVPKKTSLVHASKLFFLNKRGPGARCWPPPGFKWPLMALDACSRSGSLKLGEALYESLLHLSPLLLPVTAHTYCSHNSTLLEQHGRFLGSFRNINAFRSDKYCQHISHLIWSAALNPSLARQFCALYQYTLLISQWDSLGD